MHPTVNASPHRTDQNTVALLSGFALAFVLIVGWLGLLIPATSASAPAGPRGAIPPVVSEFTVPGASPRGLTWDGGSLWLVDGLNTDTPTPTPTMISTSTPTPTTTPVGPAEQLYLPLMIKGETTLPTPTATATSTDVSSATPTGSVGPTQTPTVTPTPSHTPTPTATQVTVPLFDTALSLDGVDDYASAPDSAWLDLGTGSTDDFTLETFFYVPDENNATPDTLIWKQGAYGLYVIYSTSVADRFIFRIWTNATDYNFLFVDAALTVGWHHVAAVFDNENTGSQDLMALYLDSNLAGSTTAFEWTPGILNSASALNLGGYLGISPNAGWMEETRLSNSVRYTGATYMVPTQPFAPDANTQALWRFDEPVGSTTLVDSSGNSNTLTGLNGAQTGHP